MPISPWPLIGHHPHLGLTRKPPTPSFPFKWLDLDHHGIHLCSNSAQVLGQPGAPLVVPRNWTQPQGPPPPVEGQEGARTRPSGNQFSPHPVPQAAHSILSQAGAGMGEAGPGEETSLASSGADPPGSSRPGRDHRPKPPGEGGQELPSLWPLLGLLSSSLNTDIHPTLDISPENTKGTRWGVNAKPLPA